MSRQPDLKWLKQRDGIWHFYRRIPTRFAHLDKRVYVRVSCETKVLSEAIVMRARLDEAA
ncbi:MAG: DUF6538 domain-containing protein [Methylobacterium sp.]